jgi:hypothetical protein
MVDFWGGIGIAATFSLPIAAAIIGIGIFIWQELRNQSNRFNKTGEQLDKMSDFLKTITLSQIHEKIAVFNDYPTQISSWNDEDIGFKTNRILEDIRAIQKVSSLLDDKQKEGLIVARDDIIKAMDKRADSSKIKAAFEVVFSK